MMFPKIGKSHRHLTQITQIPGLSCTQQYILCLTPYVQIMAVIKVFHIIAFFGFVYPTALTNVLS